MRTQRRRGSRGAGARGRFGGLLRQRDFRLFWIGETVNELGSATAAMGVPLLAVLFLHASTFEVGLLAAAGSLPWLIIGLPVGAWLDRLPVRPVMLGCDLVAAALYASIPVAYVAGVLDIGQLVLVQLVAGVANVAFTTAYQLYLPCLVGAGELTEANAKTQASYSVATLSGRGISGVLIQVIGATAGVALNAVSFLVSMACLLSIRTSEQRDLTGIRTSSVRQDMLDGVALVSRDPYLRPLALFGGVANLALAAFGALVVVFLVRGLGLGAGLAGVLTALPGVGGLLAAALAAPLVTRIGSARGMLLAGGLLPFALLAPLADPGARLAFYIVGIGVAATGVSLGTIIISTFRQTYSPTGMLGRVTVTMRFVILGVNPLGALSGGALGAWLGARDALWIVLALLAASGGCLTTDALLSARDLPAHPSQAPP
jgi:MFS family permease